MPNNSSNNANTNTTNNNVVIVAVAAVVVADDDYRRHDGRWRREKWREWLRHGPRKLARSGLEPLNECVTQ